MKIQKEILLSIFFVIAMMGGVTVLSYINAKKSVASADNISRLRVVLLTMRKIDEQDAALQIIAHQDVFTGESKYADSCVLLPTDIRNEIADLKIYGINDTSIRRSAPPGC